MPFLVRDILLVSTPYDRFILDEDGRFADKIVNEYLQLHLTGPPRIAHATTGAEALARLDEDNYELVITMTRMPDMAITTFAKHAKDVCPGIPVAVLAYDMGAAQRVEQDPDREYIDRIFVWKGDSHMLLGLVKSIEDLRNVAHDTRDHMVRVIVLLEDSPVFYSTFLALLYTEVMTQTRSLIASGLNHLDRLYRRRARPKILLATNYEDAVALYTRYREYVLAVITDMNVPRDGESDPEAGLKLIKHLRADDPDVPILLQSAEPGLRDEAWNRLRVGFVDKNSTELLAEVRSFLRTQCGFGAFIFRMPDGREVARAENAMEMKSVLLDVPGEALTYHGSNNHFSNWLFARGKFLLAKELRKRQVEEFDTAETLRRYLVESFTAFLEIRQRGQITEFARAQHHLGRDFSRLGDGSLGGKGRGVAFVYKLLATTRSIHDKYPGVHILVPRTTVVCTGEFDRFIEENYLLDRMRSARSDAELAHAFLKSRISNEVHQDLRAMLQDVRYPLAVRSSSLLEDSQFRPFAGVDESYMLPNNAAEDRTRLKQLRRAIKLVYASTFLSPARAYMRAINHRVEEEKMAVLVQRLIGTHFGDRFYPTLSGVAQSYNYYPVRHMAPEDGIAVVALGLGRTVVEGGKALRFSPAHPGILPQMGTPEGALKATQRDFYALSMSQREARVLLGGDDTMVRPGLDVAEADGSLAWVGATYSPDNQRVYDTIYRDGIRLVNFAPILKHERFPLASILKDILKLGEAGFGCPVEIEFCANLNVPEGKRPELAVVQIRPLVTSRMDSDVDVSAVPDGRVLVRSNRALGDGRVVGIQDVVFVTPERFDRQQTVAMAAEVAVINARLVEQGRPYLLIGPGRWGTADRLLGIPVNWGQVSAARIIVEVAMAGFDVDPSQGTHFFHNITSLSVGYLAVDDRKAGETVDWGWLAEQEVVEQRGFVTHARLSEPLESLIDGKTGCAAVLR